MSDDPYVRVREAFLEEGPDQVDRLQAALLRLEADRGRVQEFDEAFRMLHNLKGSAGGVGYPALAACAHEVETYLGRVQGRGAPVATADLDALFAAADALTAHLDVAVAAGPEGGEPQGASVERMEAWRPADQGAGLAPGQTGEVPTQAGAGSPPAEAAAGSASLPPRLADLDPDLALARVEYKPSTPMVSMRALLASKAVLGHAEVVATEPPDDSLAALEAQDPPVFWLALRPKLEGDEGREAAAKALTSPEVQQVTWVERPAASPAPEVEAPPPPGAGGEAAPPGSTKAEPSAEAAAPRAAKPPRESERLRVRSERIDALLHLAGELRMAREALEATLREVDRVQPLPRRLRHQLDEGLERQDRLLRRLTEDVLATRMVPIGRLFRRFPRMVRDLARKLGREVRFETDGDHTELDAKLVDRIADPVVHLLRNAVDHGLETPEVRQAAGKERAGTIRLVAYNEGQSVRVEVEDDGRGVDLEAVRRRAIQRGIIDDARAQRLDEEGVLALLTRSGFSTRDEVSSISGRGVGLDVVREVVEELNGELYIERLPEAGTRMSLRFPLTLAMTDALLVRDRRQTYALPVAHVEEVVREEDVTRAAVPGRGEAVTLRERSMPLYDLGALLGQPGDGSAGRFVVVVRAGSREVAVQVDELLGEAELVVKPLAPHMPEVAGVAGATFAGDGRVVLILDLPGALRRRGRGGGPV